METEEKGKEKKEKGGRELRGAMRVLFCLNSWETAKGYVTRDGRKTFPMTLTSEHT